jgi:hypothetical protein
MKKAKELLGLVVIVIIILLVVGLFIRIIFEALGIIIALVILYLIYLWVTGKKMPRVKIE